MRILLDAKDLIDAVEHSKPIALDKLGDWLMRHGAQIVLTMTNVTELVAPLKLGREFMDLRTLLQALERLPVCYMREGCIIMQELQSAVEAFHENRPFRPPDPYVARWDEAIQVPGRSVAKIYVGYRLDEMIYTLWKGNALPDYRRHTDQLRNLFQADRSLPKKARFSLRRNFREVTKRNLRMHGIKFPESDADRLADWIFSDPLRCPGWRLNYGVFHELEKNVNEVPLIGDIPDFAHIAAIPYADYITVDRRIAHYCLAVIKKLGGMNAKINYDRRIFGSLEKLIGSPDFA